jgi:glycosyltransferase involved in cell wall biosynthesis
MKSPLLSVAMVTYNQAPYLAQAIESVLCQKTNFDFEVIIGDDGSTDGSAPILRKFAASSDRIRLKLRPANIGANANIKDVFASCRRKYLALLEGDDYWIDDRKLQKQVDFLEANPGCTVVGAYTRIETEGSPPDVLPRDEHIPFLKGRHATLEDFLACHFLHTSSVVYRNVFGGERPDIGNMRYGDRLITLLHAQHGRIGFIPEVLSVYRKTPSGICAGISELERKKFDVQFYEQAGKFLEKRYAPVIETQLALHRKGLIYLLEEEGRPLEARDQLMKLWMSSKSGLGWRNFLKLNLRVLFPRIFYRSKETKNKRAA